MEFASVFVVIDDECVGEEDVASIHAIGEGDHGYTGDGFVAQERVLDGCGATVFGEE